MMGGVEGKLVLLKVTEVLCEAQRQDLQAFKLRWALTPRRISRTQPWIATPFCDQTLNKDDRIRGQSIACARSVHNFTQNCCDGQCATNVALKATMRLCCSTIAKKDCTSKHHARLKSRKERTHRATVRSVGISRVGCKNSKQSREHNEYS